MILTILLGTITNYAQEEARNENSIYLSYGTVVLSNQLSLAYERTLFSKKQLTTKFKVNYGNYLSNNADFDTGAKVYQQYWSVSGVQLIRFLELNVGLAYTQYMLASGFDPLPNVDYSKQEQTFEFYGSIGCRWEKNKFLFRFGIGNLELLYLGVGVCF